MGICTSTSNNQEKIIENIDFNYSQSFDEEKLNELNVKHLIKLNIKLFHKPRGKKIKYLILKKIYINHKGNFFGEIPNIKTGGVLKLNGNIGSKGNLKMEEKYEGDNMKTETSYEGSLKTKADPSIFYIEGTANKHSFGGLTENERFDFFLHFGEIGENLWILEYTFENKKTVIMPFLDLNDNEMFISNITGIANEEGNGLSIFNGIEDDKRVITLTQAYIHENHLSSDVKVYYVGVIDRIRYTIEGTIKGGKFDGTEFKLYKKKN